MHYRNGESKWIEVVDHQRLGHAAEVVEGVLQTADEVVRGLSVNRLAVGLAGMTQDDPEDVGLAATGLHPNRQQLTFRNDHRGARAEVDLNFLTRPTLHSPEGQRPGRLQTPGKSLDAVVATFKVVIRSQILQIR